MSNLRKSTLFHPTFCPTCPKNYSNLLHVVLGTLLVVSCGTTHTTTYDTITFETYSPEEYNLQSLDRITDNETNQYGHPTGGDEGHNLFFNVRDKQGHANIYHMANSYAKAMSSKTSGNNVNLMPAYCEKTNKLVYSGHQEGASTTDIFMTDATQGTAIRRLTNTPGEYEFFPDISADGSTVVFERIHSQGMLKDAYIWCQNLATEQETQLCRGRMPSFSHDGRLIVFVRFSADGNSSSLLTMNSDGTNQTELTDAKMGIVECPCFSPDDSQIVFQCRKGDKQDYDLWVVNRDGTNLTQLTFNKSFDGEPYWARDGKDGYIYFTSDRGYHENNFQIWRFKYGTYNGKGGSMSGGNNTDSNLGYKTHIVSQGETITQIAARYGVTVKSIVQWNGLKTMTLTPGMKLKVSNK